MFWAVGCLLCGGFPCVPGLIELSLSLVRGLGVGLDGGDCMSVPLASKALTLSGPLRSTFFHSLFLTLDTL